MISVPIALSISCLIFSIVFFIDSFRRRGRLYSRIEKLAPGSGLSKIKSRNIRIRSMSKTHALAIDQELVEVVEMIAAVLLAGESLFQSLARVTQMSNSHLASEFRILLSRIQLGGDMSSELSALCQRLPADSVREFSNKISLALSRGTPLANSLISLSASLRASSSALMLRRAGANETKMLVPIVLLICPVTIVFALYPSGQFLTLGF